MYHVDHEAMPKNGRTEHGNETGKLGGSKNKRSYSSKESLKSVRLNGRFHSDMVVRPQFFIFGDMRRIIYKNDIPHKKLAIITAYAHETEGYQVLLGYNITEWTNVPEADIPSLMEGINQANRKLYAEGKIKVVVEKPEVQKAEINELIALGKAEANRIAEIRRQAEEARAKRSAAAKERRGKQIAKTREEKVKLYEELQKELGL